jgi:uncharacterized membrane protein YoaK (UPF0700 family)
LSFNAGFVGGPGFLGFQELFTSDAIGNVVAPGAALVFGSSGIVTMLLALPEFICLVVGWRFRGANATRHPSSAQKYGAAS